MRRLLGLVMLLVLVAPSGALAKVTKARPLKTGQTASYGSGTDGATQAGLSRMYSDLGNGVIKDQRTGLFWEKKSDDGSIHDKDIGRSWAADTGPYQEQTADGTAFTVFLPTLNTPPCFANYCDWRLPSIVELLTLVDYGRTPATPAVFDTDCKPGCTVTTCSCTNTSGIGPYFSSTTFGATFPSHAWSIDFKLGEVGGREKTSYWFVRAVRGGP